MKRTITLLSTILVFNFYAKAQYSNPDQGKFEEEVNIQVWKPFMEAYVNNDAELFNSLHTDDVVRVSPWGIKIANEYKDAVTKRQSRPDVESRIIEFWLEHRLYKGDFGYEVGYYRVKPANGEGKTHYGRFHIVLRKADGKWRIAQDWDTGDINGYKVNSEDFDESKMLKF